MFLLKILLLVLALNSLNEVIAQEVCYRNVAAAAAEGRLCDRSCSQDGSCRKLNRECVCDGFCGWSCRKKICPLPDRPVHGEVSIDPLQGYIGAVATYSCNRGHVIIGNVRRTCLPDKTWNGSIPTCGRACPSLQELENGVVWYSNSQRGPGTIAFYRCNEGYSASGDQIRTCQSNSSWSGGHPTCIEGAVCPRDYGQAYGQNQRCSRSCTQTEECVRTKSCACDGVCGFSCIETDKPSYCPAFTGLRGVVVDLFPPSRIFRSTAVFTCDHGYEPADETEASMSTTTCLGSGKWSNEPLTCIPIGRCSTPLNVTNATIAGNRSYYVENEVAIYACDPGYYTAGPRMEIQCERQHGSLVWSDAQFECLPKRCDDPGHILHGSRAGESFVFQSSVQYECDQGYRIVGAATRYCQSNQEWSDDVPVCEAVRCPPLVAPGPPMVMTGSGNNYDDIVSFSCDVPLIVDGSSQLRCQTDGSWDGNMPTCRVIRCPPPDVPVNGGITPMADGYTFGTEVQFTCDLTLIGNERTRCDANGEWDRESPICALIDCGDPSDIANGTRSGSGTTYNSILTYACDDGYRLEGSRSIRCDANGQWSESVPICEPTFCSIEDFPTTAPVRRRLAGTPMTWVQIILPSDQPITAHGMVLSVECEGGYRPNHSYVLCRDGAWVTRRMQCFIYE